MFSVLVAPFRKVVRALVASNSPSQLATGFTLGMILGLTPKGNLIALSLFVLVFSLRCNKGFALLAAVLFTCVAAWTDPFAHKLGLAVLSAPRLQANYASMFDLPVGPWFGFQNTVVTGTLLMSAYVAYPVHWIVRTVSGVVARRTSQ